MESGVEREARLGGLPLGPKLRTAGEEVLTAETRRSRTVPAIWWPGAPAPIQKPMLDGALSPTLTIHYGGASGPAPVLTGHCGAIGIGMKVSDREFHSCETAPQRSTHTSSWWRDKVHQTGYHP